MIVADVQIENNAKIEFVEKKAVNETKKEETKND